MEQYEYLVINNTKQNNTRSKTSININPKYQKILDNLLGIKARGDAALFAHLNADNKDLCLLLSPEQINTILEQPNFRIKLDVKRYALLVDEVKQISDIKNLLTLLKNHRLLKQTELKDLIDNPQKLDFYKDKVIDNLIEQKQMFLYEWKKRKKMINDLYSETGAWPFFISTYFIECNIETRAIHAPIIFKAIDLEINEMDVYLVSASSICMMNEKLGFLLQEQKGIILPGLNNEIDEMKISQLNKELDDYLKDHISNLEVQLNTHYQDDSVDEIHFIKNNIIKTSGLMMMFASPSGGPLRQAVLDIIESSRMDDLLKTNPDYNPFTFEEEAIEDVIVKREPIVRICPTDPSQEKAILKALNDSLIIIGPPGTGKSQTIANLLANIIYKNKSALFISQKKSALDVVLERMKQLQYFCLQFIPKDTLITQKDIKQDFYKNFKNLFEIISNNATNSIELNRKNPNIKINSNTSFNKFSPTKLVSDNQEAYWKLKDKYHDLDEQTLNIFYELCVKYPTLNLENWDTLKALNDRLISNNDADLIKKALEDDISQDVNAIAQAFNFTKKWKWSSFKKDYDFRVYQLLDEYKKTKKTLDNFLFSINDYVYLSPHLSNTQILDLYKDFNHPYSQLPKSNRYLSNLKDLVSLASSRFVSIINDWPLEDKKEFNKMKGKVEKGAAVPEKFITQYKSFLKKMFKVVVANPEQLASFIDFQHDKYDYVIFDESSQIFLEKAIPYLDIAKTVIIAGDNQQMQPTNWFGIRNAETDDDKMDETKEDSLLSYAIACGLPQQQLELNYRSHFASLTSFSSKEFYDSNLKSVNKNIIENIPIEVIDVNGTWEAQTNQQEAQLMIELLKENLDKYSKIILLTLNQSQMQLVNSLLLEDNDLYQLVFSGKIILKNLENIQGDEADLVIISIGYTKDSFLSATYVGRPGGRNALNVAVTRAKEKMIVLKSLNSDDVNISNANNEDLNTFKKWLAFLELDSLKQKEYCQLVVDLENDFDSEFEREVFDWLKEQSFDQEYKIVNQYPVGSYRIDFAILNAKTNHFILGLEVDGFKYHFGAKKTYSDFVRQEFLEAKGYFIVRISEYNWKVNRAKLLDEIKHYLYLSSKQIFQIVSSINK